MSPKSIWRQLLMLLRPFSGRILLALFLSAITIGSSVALMMTSAWLISTSALQLGITSLGVAPTGVRFFGLSRAVLRYLERLLSHDITFRLLARLRVWFYERIEPLSPAQIAAFSSGDLMSRVVSDIEELQNLYIRVVAPPIVAIIVTAGIGIAFAILDVQVALVALGFILAAGTLLPLLTWWIGNRIGSHVVDARAQISNHLVDSIQGMADSLAYAYADERIASLKNTSQILAQKEKQEAGLNSLQTGLSVLMVNMAAFWVLVVAMHRVEGIFLATVTLGIIAAFEAITPLALATQNLGKEIAAAQRVFEIIDHQPAIIDPPSPQTMPVDNFDLSIQGVSFRYAEDEAFIFHDFSLDLAHGKHISIMGESGSGKSSLVNILMRFWDYESGQIIIGGTDLKALAHEDVRQIFGVMTQRVHLFNTSIQENIRIANKQASDEAIMEAAKIAQVHDFILSLPDGYKTHVGENGLSLSGGERQRIALARLLLKPTPIWILDEITANLDPITAQNVMESVVLAAGDRTIILMTHRPILLKNSEFGQVITLRGQGI